MHLLEMPDIQQRHAQVIVRLAALRIQRSRALQVLRRLISTPDSTLDKAALHNVSALVSKSQMLFTNLHHRLELVLRKIVAQL
jgi:hypothetical protein